MFKLRIVLALVLAKVHGLQQPVSLGTKRSTPLKMNPAAVALNPAAVAAVTLMVPMAAVAEAPGWVLPVSNVLDPLLFLAQFMMLGRVLLSWYPEVNVNKLPYNLIAWPTEPILRVTRGIVPPAFGVDVSPIVWIAIASLARELLLGQQGILVLMARS